MGRRFGRLAASAWLAAACRVALGLSAAGGTRGLDQDDGVADLGFANWEPKSLAKLEDTYAARTSVDHKEEFTSVQTWYEADVSISMQPWRMQHKTKAHAGNGYLFFDTDPGGLNNIRMTFEYVIDVARASNRTLVLPPPEGWYLIDWGPKAAHAKGGDKHWIKGDGRSAYADFWDIADLQSKVVVITAQEFFERERMNYKIPLDAEPSKQSNNNPDGSKWKLWLEKAATLSRGKPCKKAYDLARLDASVAPLVHIPAYLFAVGSDAAVRRQEDTEFRYLHCEEERKLRTVDLHWKPVFYQMASGPVSAMGFRQYVALHLRRNDFQYTQAPNDPRKLVEEIQRIARPRETVYIASDEVDQAWWSAFRQAMSSAGHRVATFQDFLPGLSRRGHDERYSGVVEMLICAGARDFHGTQYSTFSKGIQLLRDDLKQVNRNWAEKDYASEWKYISA